MKACDIEVVCFGQVCSSCFAIFLMSKSFGEFCNSCFATFLMSKSFWEFVIAALPFCLAVNYYRESIVCNMNVVKYFWFLLNCALVRAIFVYLHCLMN